jgi:Type IV secretion-system coupling protein DNA-binding domain
MGFLNNLFGNRPKDTVVLQPRKPHEIAAQRAIEPVNPLPPVVDDYAPDMLDLGWYYSETKRQLQMAKIPLTDRAVHTYVIGASGSGKTKFLEFLIQQDIQLANGFGIIDPHGDLIEETKGFLVEYYQKTQDESIFDRVVIVDPTDPNYTVAFNVLEILPGVAPIEQAQELISVFKRIWADSWGARMEDLLRNSLIALGQASLTLVDLPQFLTTSAFRSQVMAKVSNPMARLYFERFDSLSKANQLTWSDPVTNKVNAFLADERISQMLSQPKSSFTLREVMDKKKILLLKLNKGKLRDSADLLGSLFMAKIQLAAFSRTDIPEAARVPFYLYIDEFQNFASESFNVVLSEARKYGLSLIMAHQTLEQIPPELRSVILGNAGIQVYFRMNRKDAELLAKEAFSYDGYQVKTVQMRNDRIDARYWSLGEEWERNFTQLQNMPPRHCLIKHKIQGGMLQLETVSIKPAFEALGMRPEEYPDLLATLPFGAKYQLERSALSQLAAGQTDTVQPAKEYQKAQPTSTPVQEQEPQTKAASPQEVKPQLDEQQQQFLDYIITNPETALTAVYRGIGVSVWKGNQIRDSLKEEGYIAEIETRLGRRSSRTHYFIPTFTAFDLLGQEPPAGRGGAIHRHIQRLIEEGATANGFTAQCEYDLGNGGIVDVHLEKGEYKIAVEIAVASKPQREVAHIKHCLAVGYDKVFDVFAEEKMMNKTQEALPAHVSPEELTKVQLLHLSKLSELIYAIVGEREKVVLPVELTPEE